MVLKVARDKVHQSRRDLPRLPAVGPCQPTGDSAIGDPVQYDARFVCKSLASCTDLFDRMFRDRQGPLASEAVDRGPVESFGELHRGKVDQISTIVKSPPPIQFADRSETDEMAEKIWEKRPWFLQWVEDAREQLKAAGSKGTYAEVADLMELAPNSMKKYTSEEWTGAKPGPDALRKLGDYLGRDYRILFDGPDTPPVGIDPAAWALASETRKLFTITMFHRSEAFAPEHFKAFNQMVASGIALQRDRKSRS